MDKILNVPLFKFAGAIKKIFRSNFVSKSFANLGNTKGNFYAGGVNDIFEIQINGLAGFTPEISMLFFALDNTNFCLLYTSDAADDLLCVDLGGRRIIKKKQNDICSNHDT